MDFKTLPLTIAHPVIHVPHAVLQVDSVRSMKLLCDD